MSKKLIQRNVYSIYSKSLEDYPYFPFYAKNNTQALRIFFKMLLDKQKICAEPELHLIGVAKFKDDFLITVEPSLYVYKIGLNTKEAVIIYKSLSFEKKIRDSLNRFFLKVYMKSIISSLQKLYQKIIQR